MPKKQKLPTPPKGLFRITKSMAKVIADAYNYSRTNKVGTVVECYRISAKEIETHYEVFEFITRGTIFESPDIMGDKPDGVIWWAFSDEGSDTTIRDDIKSFIRGYRAKIVNNR